MAPFYPDFKPSFVDRPSKPASHAASPTTHFTNLASDEAPAVPLSSLFSPGRRRRCASRTVLLGLRNDLGSRIASDPTAHPRSDVTGGLPAPSERGVLTHNEIPSSTMTHA